MPAVQASTVYWDNDATGTGNIVTTGVGLGGTGNWDTSTLNWWPGSGTTDQAWVNGNNDTAAFGGTAGTVTLTANITVGGLLFNTTGYTIATGANALTFGATDNTIALNNVSSATITGAVAGTGSNMTLTGGVLNGSTTGTLTLNGTSTTGWSGTTTVNNGMTMALAGSSQALVNTTGITLNGGGITLSNTSSGEAALDRVANGAGITSNGGTFTVTNTNLASTTYAETIGTVALTSGQLNVISTNNNAAGTSQTLTLSGLTHTGSTNTSTVAFGGGSLGGLSTNKNQILITGQATTAANQIMGPWATIGSSAASQTDYAAYGRNAGTTNAFGVQGAGIAASVETTWTTSGNSYTQGAAQTLTANRTITSLRNTAGTATTQLGAFNLETLGLLNGASTPWTIAASGAGVIRQNGTAAANLYVTTGAGGITISALIANNTGALTLVKSGTGGTLTLSGANTYTGATVVNAGVLATGSLANGGTASGIGQSANDATNLVLNGGTLQYTGAAQATDRLFGVGLAGGTLDASGAGAVNFNNTGSMGFNSQTGVRTLTLTGTNTGANTLAAVIGDNSGATTLIKSGAGTWVLSGANIYTGSTFVNAGTLVADTAANATVLSSSSGLVLGGGTFQLKGNTGTQSQILNGLTLAGGTSSVVDANNLGTSTTLDLSGTGGTLGITRNTGATVDFKATNGALGTTSIIKTAQANDANGILGAWATVNGGADLAKNDGSNVITAYTGYTDIAALGSTLADGTTTNVRINSTGTAGNVALGATTTNINTLMQNSGTAATVDAASKTLRVGTTGGLFITPGGADLTIGTAANSGTLTAGGSANTAGELFVTNNSSTGTLRINSAVANNGTGAVSLTKSGSGLAVLTGTNTYTGATTIGAGTLQIGAGGTTGALATTGTITNNGILLFNRSDAVTQGTHFSSSAITGTGSVVQAGGGTLTLGAVANSFTGGLVIKNGTVAGGANANSFGASTSVITIGDSAGGSANATLTGGAATYLNPITVASTNTGTATITNSSASAVFSGAITLNNHSLTLLGTSANFTVSGGITGTGNLTLNSGSTGLITTQGTINNVGTITNIGAGNPSNGLQFFASIGSNVTGVIEDSLTAQITLYGNSSSYVNGITIKKGQLNASGANALGGSTNIVTIGDSSGSNSSTLGGSGTYSNAISVASGNTGAASIINTYQNAVTFSGLITLNSHDLTVNTLGVGASNNVTLSGGIASTGSGGNLTINAQGTHAITLSGGTVNNAGTITNSSTGNPTNVISAAIGANVTGIIQSSTTSALNVSGAITANSTATTLKNTLGTKLLTVSGGVTGTGNLIVKNDSSTVDAVTFTTTGINNTGTVTNSGSGSGGETIGVAIGSSVTGVVQNSTTSTLTLTATNTYSGSTTISAGTLALGSAGTIANSSGVNLGTLASQGTLDLTAKTSFAFGTGQTLSGYGAVNIGTGKTLTINGTFAPGNSPGVVSVIGDLTLGSTSTTNLEIISRAGGVPVAGTDFDRVSVSGAVVFGGTLNINATGLTGLIAGDSFQLFTASSYTSGFTSVAMTGAYAPSFTNNLGVWTGSDLGLGFTFTESTGILSVGAIPEPATYAAIFGGLALAGAVLRSRKRRG